MAFYLFVLRMASFIWKANGLIKILTRSCLFFIIYLPCEYSDHMQAYMDLMHHLHIRYSSGVGASSQMVKYGSHDIHSASKVSPLREYQIQANLDLSEIVT